MRVKRLPRPLLRAQVESFDADESHDPAAAVKAMDGNLRVLPSPSVRASRRLTVAQTEAVLRVRFSSRHTRLPLSTSLRLDHSV